LVDAIKGEQAEIIGAYLRDSNCSLKVLDLGGKSQFSISSLFTIAS
jgi:hypothetical protein